MLLQALASRQGKGPRGRGRDQGSFPRCRLPRGHRVDRRTDRRYQGPWQNWLRDIDPTFTASPPRGRPWNYRQGNPGVWWTAGRFADWAKSDGLGDWVRMDDDLPSIEDLLVVQRPGDGTRWLNGNSYFAWRQEPPVGRKLFEVERGEVAYSITAYLTQREEASKFVEWAKGLSSVEAGIEDVEEVSAVFIGEHGWAPAAMYKQVPLGSWNEESGPCRMSPVRIEAVATKYPLRRSVLDDTGWENNWFQFPSQKVVKTGGLRWSGRAADFLTLDGTVTAFDPSAYTAGPCALLVREDFMKELMDRHGIGIVWTVVCLKSVRLLDPAPGFPLLRVSGAYRLSETGLVGFMRPELVRRQRPPWEPQCVPE